MDNNNNKNLSDSYVKALNKASSKVTKPTRTQFIPNPVPNHFHQQTPVYIVGKEDFRDVVQRLTGSLDYPPNNNPIPPTPPNNINNIIPIPNHRYTKGASSSSSRLQRNRPPPLFQNNNNVVGGGSGSSSSSFLPPLPPVHQASESPVSAYMRDLQNTLAGPSNGSSGGEVAVAKESPTSSYMRVLQNSIYARYLPPPRVPQSQPHPPQRHEQVVDNKNTDDLQAGQGQGSNGDGNVTCANSELFPVMAESPVAFGGRVSSPSGQYGTLSPGSLLFSPTTGLPLSPLPSPTWKF